MNNLMEAPDPREMNNALFNDRLGLQWSASVETPMTFSLKQNIASRNLAGKQNAKEADGTRVNGSPRNTE